MLSGILAVEQNMGQVSVLKTVDDHASKVWQAARLACLELTVVGLRPIKNLNIEAKLSCRMPGLTIKGIFSRQGLEYADQVQLIKSLAHC